MDILKGGLSVGHCVGCSRELAFGCSHSMNACRFIQVRSTAVEVVATGMRSETRVAVLMVCSRVKAAIAVAVKTLQSRVRFDGV